MPRWLPENMKLQEKQPQRFSQKTRQYQEAFQQKTSAKKSQKPEVIIDNTGSNRDEATAGIHGFSVFESTTKIGERLKLTEIHP